MSKHSTRHARARVSRVVDRPPPSPRPASLKRFCLIHVRHLCANSRLTHSVYSRVRRFFFSSRSSPVSSLPRAAELFAAVHETALIPLRSEVSRVTSSIGVRDACSALRIAIRDSAFLSFLVATSSPDVGPGCLLIKKVFVKDVTSSRCICTSSKISIATMRYETITSLHVQVHQRGDCAGIYISWYPRNIANRITTPSIDRDVRANVFITDGYP